MKPRPQPPLVLVPAQLLLGILVKAFNMMPPMRIFHQHLQPRRAREVAPVVGPLAATAAQRAFTDQPPMLPLALRILTPRPYRVEFGRQPAAAAFAPAEGAPTAGRAWRHDGIDPLQPWRPTPRERYPEVCPSRDDIAFIAGFQIIEKVGIVALISVGRDTCVGNAPGIGLVQQRQRNLGFGLKLDCIGNVRLGSPGGIGTPDLRQVQAGRQRPGQRAFGILAGHRHLAVRDFAGGTGILARDPDRGVALFEKSDVVKNQHRIAFCRQGQQAFHSLLIERIGVPLPSSIMTGCYLKLQLRWRDTTNTVISTSTIKTYTAATSGWNAVTASRVAPVGTTNAQVMLVVSGLSTTMYVDAFVLK
jgi:hypothetical protein